MVTVLYCKCCNALKTDGLNFDGLAGKHQKHQNFPHLNFALYGIRMYQLVMGSHTSCNGNKININLI